MIQATILEGFNNWLRSNVQPGVAAVGATVLTIIGIAAGIIFAGKAVNEFRQKKYGEGFAYVALGLVSAAIIVFAINFGFQRFSDSIGAANLLG